MIQYLVFAWDTSDVQCEQSAHQLCARLQGSALGWRELVSQRGLLIRIKPEHGPHVDQPYLLRDGHGAILGRLFDRDYVDRDDTNSAAPSSVEFDEQTTRRLVAEEGSLLARRYWGRYVAFISDPIRRTQWVLRDPTGDVPCHHIRVRGVDVYFSRLDDLSALGPPQLSINRKFVLGYLTLLGANSTETGLREVSTVLAGQRIAHRAGIRTADFFWNPLEIADSARIEDVEEATKLTRRVVRTCIHAWASCFDGIALRLSGGLDSSIVAACLADAPTRPKVICKNYYDDGPSTDEREYARLVATRCGFDLLEFKDDRIFRWNHGLKLPRAITPYVWNVNLDAAKEQALLDQQREITADFSGQGGDELFHRHSSLYDSVDFLRLHGWRPRLFDVALNDAQIDGHSLWRVLRVASRYRRGPFKLEDLRNETDFPALIRRECIDEARRYDELRHPLFKGAAPIPPCKFEQAHLICSNASRYFLPQLLEYQVVPIMPLLSQPHIELALRIPVYVLRSGARDRAIARRAFSHVLPAAIVTRRSKAMGTPFLRQVLLGNIDIARELLLDGYLVREGILDRKELEHALAGQHAQARWRIMEIDAYLCVEAWARAWNGPQQRAAA